jgi:hypothetical protein
VCFSPAASFVTAGLTAAIGLVALTRVNHWREAPLAATPILFAVQQTIEGLLWLHLPMSPDGRVTTDLTLLFLMFAQVLWPVYAPLAVWFIEPSERRRRWLLALLAVGVAVSAWLLWGLLTGAHEARIGDQHIVYSTRDGHPIALGLGYLAATSLPLLISSRQAVIVLGVIVLVGCVTAYVFYLQAFQSVWCYFAAAGSVVLLAHFQWARPPPLPRAREGLSEVQAAGPYPGAD